MEVDNPSIENAVESAVKEVQWSGEQYLDRVDEDSDDDEREDEHGHQERDEPAGTLLSKGAHGNVVAHLPHEILFILLPAL